MASIIKAKRLSLEFAKKNYPILYNTIEALNDAGLSDKQKDLLRQLDESWGGDSEAKHRPKSKGFFDGVKKFFDDLTG